MGRMFPSLRNLYSNLRIRNKIFLLVFLIMFGCFITTYIVLQYAYAIYDGQIYQKSSQVLNLSSALIENEIKKIESVSFSVATDPVIQSRLIQLKQNPSQYDQLQIRTDIVDRLIQYAGNEPYLYSIQIIGYWGQEFTAGQNLSRSAKRTRLIQETAGSGSGEIRWIYPDPTDPVLTAARKIRSYEYLSLDEIGTLIIGVNVNKIVEDTINGTGLGHGEIVIAAGNEPIYPTSESAKPHVSLPLPATGGPHNYEISQIGGKTYFIAHASSNYTGWTYRNIIPFDHIFSKIIWMKRILLVVFTASLLLVIGIAMNFARTITRPIENLIGKMKKVQNGNIDALELEASSPMPLAKDEVGQLQRTFRIMIQQINELIHENFTKQLTIKETQFQALQAQINPHFLYNTLESINWLAKVNGQGQISKMVESLGYLFRSSISMKEALISIEDDIQIAEHYLTIQKFRFDDRLRFQLDIPGIYRQGRIPKLTLQPLLENAIHYGLEPMVEPCLITIKAFEEQGRLVLAVEDQGPGMEPSRLEQVRRGEHQPKGKGIGLKNIEERIKLAFGDAYGIHIDSEPGKGTRVYVYLPL
jgi:two-component system sensor histidine kinase YesM